MQKGSGGVGMQGQGSVVVLLALGFPELAVNVPQLSVTGQRLLLAVPAGSLRCLLLVLPPWVAQRSGRRGGGGRVRVPGHILQDAGARRASGLPVGTQGTAGAASHGSQLQLAADSPRQPREC